MNLDLVDPRIGTDGPGNCLVGPFLPFGVVRLGPDTTYPQPTAGYNPGRPISGFSHTHVAGTGGFSRYGNVRVKPFGGPPQYLGTAPWIKAPVSHRAAATPVHEESRPGAYLCEFPSGVRAELGCTRHVGVHRYHFPEAAGQAHLLIDFASVIHSGAAPAGQMPFSETWEMEATSAGGELHFLNAREICGRSDFLGGWGHLRTYSVFFFIRFAEPFQNAEWAGVGGRMGSGVHGFAHGAGLRAAIVFPGTTRDVAMEVGISFVSVALAREAVEKESAGRTLEAIRQDAVKEWETWFGPWEIDGGTDAQRTLFATSLYHLLCMPTDLGVDRENARWKSDVRQFTDIYCLWDSVRCANSLFHLVAPEFSADLMNALLDIYDHDGWIPDAHIVGQFAFQQSGCAAEILLSEAAQKRVPGVDYRRALAACVHNAENYPPDLLTRGRRLDDYENLGYLSTQSGTACVSRHLEYCYQDWCIARLAEVVGDAAIQQRFDKRSERLWNLWRDEKGTFWPKRSDGTWDPTADPDRAIGDFWNDPFTYEGTLRTWSFNGLHDIAGMIRRLGGPGKFIEALDTFLKTYPEIEKETRMHIPHLYQYVGRPDRTADIIRHSLGHAYHTGAKGLPDNEDMGVQSAYYIWNSVGLYPIYGQTLYSLVPPVFQRSVLPLGQSGRTLEIRSSGDGGETPYLTGVILNGTPLGRPWLRHEEIRGGGVLELVVGPQPGLLGIEMPATRL